MKLYNNRVTAVLATALMLGQLSAPALAAEVSASTGSVNINEAFSDPLFQAWLKDQENLNGIGADGVLTEEERAAVLAVDVSGETIQSLSGIELFPNLRSLNISNNRITALDLSHNTGLTWLYAANNQLASLDLNANTKLQGVDLSGNQLTTLDVSKLTELGYLYVDYNLLTELDLSANNKLTGLGFTATNNHLQTIKLPNAPALTVELTNFAAQNPSTGYEKVLWLQDGSPVEETIQANGQILTSEGVPNSFTLSFNANGGRGSVETITGNYGQEVTVPQNGFTRYGHTFAGWSTQANGLGDTYQPDEKISDLGKKYDGQRVTLYAQWTPIIYSIIFDANGGSGSASEDAVAFDQKVTLPNEGFTNDTEENLTLAGWASSAEGPVLYAAGSQVQGLSGDAGHTVTLYAVWSLSAEGEQATRLESLAQSFAAYFSSDYTTQDWTALNAIYNEAVEKIGHTQETGDMDAIVTTCEEDMANVPTRVQRETEVSDGFKYAHQEVLGKLNGSAVNAANAADLLEKATAAHTALTGEGLKAFSELYNEEDLESVTASVLSSMDAEAAQLENLRAAAQWVVNLEGISQKAMSEVRSTDVETYRSAAEGYTSLPSEQSNHIDASLSANLTDRQALAETKRSAVSELSTAYAGFDLSLYSEKGKAALEKAHTDGANAVESASSMQAVITAKEEASAKMNAVLNAEEEDSNPIPDVPDSGSGSGSGSGGSSSTGGGSGTGSGSGTDSESQEKPAEVTTITDEKTGPVAQVSTASDGKITASVTVPQNVHAVTVHIPCTASDSTVAVLVHADGTREILTKVTRTADGLALRLDGSATVEIVDNAKSFGDVADNAWFASSVQFASSRDLFNGTGNGAFAPEADMTRSMVVTVLHRLEGTPESTANTSFDDLNSGWYTEAVDWAVGAGITTGNGNGSFLPDESITRESLAVMLYRYANHLGLDTKTTGALDDRFLDADHVSGWASDAVIWATEQGILQGSNDHLRPNDDTSRAEVATMLMRFVSLITEQDAKLAE